MVGEKVGVRQRGMALILANGHVSALFRPMTVMIMGRRAKRLVSEVLVAGEGYAQPKKGEMVGG